MKKVYRATWILTIFLFTFCKKEATLPLVYTNQISQITTTTAVSGGELIDDGGAVIISKGICWNTSDKPTIDENTTNEAGELEFFTSKLSQLTPGTTYYIRAYATNSAGTGYGKSVRFKTVGDKPSAEVVSTFPVSGDSVVFHLRVHPHSLSTIVIIEWGESINYGNTSIPAQSPILDSIDVWFPFSLSGLTPGATYHYRIKAMNELGTTYSNDIEFKTLCFLPTVVLDYTTGLLPKSATINGSVSPGYASTVVVFEWGTSTSYGNIISASQSPISGNKWSKVSATLTGLTTQTTYHYRIKATNNAGTKTSESRSFTTIGHAPSVSVDEIADLQTNSAKLIGHVMTYFLPTTVVFEWGTTTAYGNTLPASQSPLSGAPYQNQNYVSVLLSGLTLFTTYHYRIKATNELGTDYSNNYEFTTLGRKPMAHSKPANVKINSATLNATVNPNSLPTTIIFEWGTSTTYGTSVTLPISPVTSNQDINVSFDLSGLNPETEYHYRIKAINELGTTYGYDSWFTTYSVKDADNNYYHSRVIGTQTWMTGNLKTTMYDNGDLISTTDPLTKDITSESTPKYQWAPEGGEGNVPVYGRLYTWYAVTDSRKICPSGWHVPSDAEWTTLVDFAGGKAVGGKLKEYGTQHWSSPNNGGSSAYGFYALPAGSRTITGYLGGLNDVAEFWTSTDYNVTEAWKWELMYISAIFNNGIIDKKFAASVRCIKD